MELSENIRASGSHGGSTPMTSDQPAVLFPSLYDRTIARRRPWWATVLLVIAIYLPTLASSYRVGTADFFANPLHRSILTAPTVIAYVLLIAPILGRMAPRVVASLWPTLPGDPKELADTIARASRVAPFHEVLAIGAGLLLGILVIGRGSLPGLGILPLAVIATNYVMMGLLGWTGYYSISGTRVVSAMLRRPPQVDPLDIKPFEAIGRQSLAFALAFVGGNTIGLLMGNFDVGALLDFRFWLLYLPLSLIPILVFFLNMRLTHRVLADAKQRDLAEVRQQLYHSYRELLHREQDGRSVGDLPAVIAALGTFEKTLIDARTWPYNTATLRTLTFSVFIPLGTVLIRPLLERVFG